MGEDRFDREDVEGWRGHLNERGYVVVAGALTPEQTSDGLDAIWALMEALGDVDREDPETLSPSANWPPMLHGGMIQYLGHTSLQWQMRELCAPIFAEYHGVGVDELATSFDGLCFMHSARNYRRAGNLMSFLHTDQSPLRKGEWSIQGLVTLTDSGPDAGGLVVVPDTHLEHEDFFDGHACQDQKSDWYKLDEDEKEQYAERVVKVEASAGDLLLWDSRTLHANDVPTEEGTMRACVYVCMLPQARLSKQVRKKRKKAFDERRTSNHHPAEGFKTFPKLPRFVTDRDAFWERVLELQDIELSDLQESLAAF
ncbi:MAG: phytanoyl-CoA dioxygenase family protein [Myxococcota bacterium]|jgi:hypothetical protein|nr:phytanoyl-CoA dioxygenase family protein [Myxococcota bacterium]